MNRLLMSVIIALAMYALSVQSALAEDINASLLSAAERGDIDSVRSLLLRGAKADTKRCEPCYYDTPLINAINKGHEGVALLLINHGAISSTKDRSSGQALYAAAENGMKEVVNKILDLGVDVNFRPNSNHMTPIFYALKSPDIVALLIDRGADVNVRMVPEGSMHSPTPLINAVAMGYAESAEILIKRGADVNAEDYSFGTPLVQAAEAGHIDIVKLLVENGAQYDTKDGFSALLRATRNGHIDIVRYLYELGIDLNESDENGKTAIIFAAHNSSVNDVNKLISMGAKVDIADNAGLTPLMYAVQHGNAEMVALLIRNGANVNRSSNYGVAALSFAVMHSAPSKTIKLLVNNGASVDAKNKFGESALMFAAEFGETDAVRLLIELGADVDATANNGDTVISKAVIGNHREIVEMLEEQGVEYKKVAVFDINGQKQGGSHDTIRDRYWADTNKVKIIKSNPFFMKVESDHNIMEEYIKGLGDINGTLDEDGTTQLMERAFYGQVNIVQEFLAHGALVDKQSSGGSALVHSVAGRNYVIAHMLIAHGANLDYLDYLGDTSLMITADNGDTDMAKLLIDHGADVNFKSHDGWTAMKMAKHHDYEIIVQLLVDAGAKE